MKRPGPDEQQRQRQRRAGDRISLRARSHRYSARRRRQSAPQVLGGKRAPALPADQWLVPPCKAGPPLAVDSALARAQCASAPPLVH
ncbi:hypothetical protein MRX96_039468 [Rhipicephalus microplus]